MTTLLLFLVSTGAWLLLASLLGARNRRLTRRLQELHGAADGATTDLSFSDFTQRTLPSLGAMVAPKCEKEQSSLKARLTNAGIYQAPAFHLYLATKLLLTFGPLTLVGVLYLLAPAEQTLSRVGSFRFPAYQTFLLLGGALFAILGNLLPSLWLDSRIRARQVSLRRALPDAMDLMVVCLEAGMSLPGAIQRVSDVLGNVHPVLGMEMEIVEQSMQLGFQPGEALMEFGKRCNLEEIRRLAAVVAEAERVGGSMARTLRQHAETLREQRTQRAEEMGHKAAVKILFPTVALIFPAIFVIILGPAAIQISKTLIMR